MTSGNRRRLKELAELSGGPHDVISMIFHYHYQWNKRDERERNVAAMREHLVYIEALKSRNRAKVAAAVKTHMAGGRAGLRRLFGAVDFFSVL